MAESFYGGRRGFSFTFQQNSLENSNGFFADLGTAEDTVESNSIWGGIKRGDIYPGEYAIVSNGEHAGEIYRISIKETPVLVSTVTLPAILPEDIEYEEGPKGPQGDPGEGCLLVNIQDFDPHNPSNLETVQQLLIVNEPTGEDGETNPGDLVVYGTTIRYDTITVQPLFDVCEDYEITYEKGKLVAPSSNNEVIFNANYDDEGNLVSMSSANDGTRMALRTYYSNIKQEYDSLIEPNTSFPTKFYEGSLANAQTRDYIGLLTYDLSEAFLYQSAIHFYVGGDLPPVVYVGGKANLYQINDTNFLTENELENFSFANVIDKVASVPKSSYGTLYLITKKGLILVNNFTNAPPRHFRLGFVLQPNNANVGLKGINLGVIMMSGNSAISDSPGTAIANPRNRTEWFKKYNPFLLTQNDIDDMSNLNFFTSSQAGDYCTAIREHYANTNDNEIIDIENLTYSMGTRSCEANTGANGVLYYKNLGENYGATGKIVQNGTLYSGNNSNSISQSLGVKWSGDEDKPANTWEIINDIFNFSNAYINIY